MSDIKKHTYLRVIVVIIMILFIFSTFYFRRENINNVREYSTKDILEYKTKYLEDNSDIINILSGIDISERIKFKSVVLDTNKAPHKVTLNYYEGATNDNNADRVIYENEFSKISIIMFSLVENLDFININFKNKSGLEESFSYSRSNMENVIGNPLWNISNSKKEYNRLIEQINIMYPRSISELVYNTEIKENGDEIKEESKDRFSIIATKIHGYYTEEEFLKVFTTTSIEQYRLEGTTAIVTSSKIVNAAITYKKDSVKGGYTLEEYERSKDGVDLIPSIKKYCILPVSKKKIEGLAPKITNYLSNNDELLEIQKSKLVKYSKDNSVNISYFKKHEGDSKVPLFKNK